MPSSTRDHRKGEARYRTFRIGAVDHTGYAAGGDWTMWLVFRGFYVLEPTEGTREKPDPGSAFTGEVVPFYPVKTTPSRSLSG